jgi:hypothetical protein
MVTAGIFVQKVLSIMICERCGKELPETSKICPICGTLQGQKAKQPPTNYGEFPRDGFGAPSPYGQGYPGAYASYTSPQMYEEAFYKPAGYGSAFAPPTTPQHQPPIYPPVSRAPVQTPSTDNALITEIILSLIGIFGIGWLMTGQTLIGVLLLLGSILVYWPLIILGTVVTFGFGLICLGPMAVGLIILNAVLLNNYIKRQTVDPMTHPQQVTRREQ